MPHILMVVIITTYFLISFTSIRALFLKPPQSLFKMLLAMALIFPTLVGLYLFLLLGAHYDQLLFIPAAIGIAGAVNWNCITVSELIEYVHFLEYQKILSEQQQKYSLTPKVVLKYIDFNNTSVIDYNVALSDWLSDQGIDSKESLVGLNWYDLLQHKQEAKIKHQLTACSANVYTHQISRWKETDTYFKWNMYPLSVENKTYVIEWTDDSKNQNKIQELEKKLSILESTNKKMISLGFKSTMEQINAGER